MNFFDKICSCFWQNDEEPPNQGETQLGVVIEEPVPIKKTEETDSEELEQKIQKLKEEIIEMMIPVMMMSKVFWSFLDEIEKAAKELNVTYSLLDNIAYCEGKAKNVEKFETLLQKFHNVGVGGEEKRIVYQGDDSSRKRTWEDRKFVIPLDFTKEDVDVILFKARKKELHFLYKDGVLKVRGNKFVLSMFLKWLEEFTKYIRKSKADFKEFLEKLKLETVTEEIRIHDLQKQEDIMKKASILEVNCIFGEDNKRTLEISGRGDKVRCFKSYLQAINPMFPKDLYPKYWDFGIESDYAEIEVLPKSEEFEEISSKIFTSLDCVDLKKIKRIQNKGLMNNFLAMICSEKKTKEERTLLFYGTEIQKPEKIYKYSKTGFDLSYASFKGRFGRGLHFPITALYAHGYAYKPNPKRFQVLVADVFLGKTLISTRQLQNPEKGISEDYDSLLDPNDIFVIYKNSQSYPLYLVEYTLQLSAVKFSERKEGEYLSEEQKEEIEEEDEEEETKEQLENLPKQYRRKSYESQEFEGPSLMCLQRVSKELEALKNDKFMNENILVDSLYSKNYNEWVIPLIGPPETPYEGGLFQLSITFPNDFPIDAPLVRFRTKIYHPCVLRNGKINLEYLEDWAPTHKITELLASIYRLLCDPTSERPCDELKGIFQKDRAAFDEKARAWTRLSTM